MKYIDLNTREGRHTFYTSPTWKAIRILVLNRDIYCQECLKSNIYTVATEVDHIVDIVDDPSKCMDLDNLQGLCKKCHSRKTFNTRPSFQRQTYTNLNKKWKI